MPRQPLLPRYQDAILRFPANALAARPEMATLIGQSTGLWAQVEVQMALILSALMKSKSDAAVAFFLSIRNSRLQRDGLAAAATSVLKDENLDLFSAISNVHQTLEGQRNDLVHGIFALADNYSDILIWFEPKEHANFFADLLAKVKNSEPYSIDEIKKDAFVYRPKDISGLVIQIEELWGAAMAFATHLRSPNKLASASLRQLCAGPQIQQELSQLKLARKNMTEARPSQPESKPGE
jgi:hypothetical protein